VLAKLAGIVGDGGRCVSDLVVLAGQGALFGVVASVLMASLIAARLVRATRSAAAV
jgi:hypothetical protein